MAAQSCCNQRVQKTAFILNKRNTVRRACTWSGWQSTARHNSAPCALSCMLYYSFGRHVQQSSVAAALQHVRWETSFSSSIFVYCTTASSTLKHCMKEPYLLMHNATYATYLQLCQPACAPCNMAATTSTQPQCCLAGACQVDASLVATSNERKVAASSAVAAAGSVNFAAAVGKLRRRQKAAVPCACHDRLGVGRQRLQCMTYTEQAKDQQCPSASCSASCIWHMSPAIMVVLSSGCNRVSVLVV